MMPFCIKLIEKTFITKTLVTLHFYLFKQLINFNPGQYLVFCFKNNEEDIYRPYSIATYNEHDLTISISIKLFPDGLASAYFSNLCINSLIEVLGPYGDFVLHDTRHIKRLILIATSTGIVPYNAMIDILYKKLVSHNELKIYLIHGVHNEEELLYRENFDLNFSPNCLSHESSNLLKVHPRFHYKFALNNAVHKERVQKHLYNLKPLNEDDNLYLCGNPNMIYEIVNQLEKEKSKTSVFVERFA